MLLSAALTGVVMTSLWWLLIAFWFGTCCGVLLTAVLVANRNAGVSREGGRDAQPQRLTPVPDPSSPVAARHPLTH